jgi:hypothetical protein
MNKGNLKFIAILLVLCLSACSNVSYVERKYKGKQFKAQSLKKLNDSGHHLWKGKRFDIEYDYSIDNKSKTIAFEGMFTYTVPLEKREYISEQVLLEYEYFQLIILFADYCRKIIAVESANIKPGQYLVDPFKFKATVPYKESYAYIHFSYAYRAVGF